MYGLFFILLAGGTTGGLYYTGYFDATESEEEMAEETPVELPPIYLPLEPPFVVNFTHRGTLRYLQVSLELMYQEQEIIDEINNKMPAVRNALIMLFSNQNYESLSSFEGKEQLRQSILLAVNNEIGLKAPDPEIDPDPDAEVLQDQAESDAEVFMGQVYFTNFVMQ